MSILLLSSAILLLPLRSAFADSYSEGYNEGCYDAGRDFKGLNGHGREKGLYLRIECKVLYNVDNKNIT